jgi:KaiC/GvpD/RAD55 family RecA-like ATPase
MAAEDGVDLHLRDGDHACILFGSDEEHRIVVAQFLADGLRSGQRVMNIACAHSPATMRSYLARAGADPERSEATGQLTILEGKDAYTPSGAFDPDAMVAMLTQTVAAAVAAGWNGMRGSGDMSWAADAPDGV